MLQPKRTKHRKTQKGRMKGNTKRGATLAFGTFGLKALDSVWLTSRQIESARQAMTRHMKREGNVWIRVFPDKPITAKPAEVRMGKGKGNPEGWAAIVQPGRIIYPRMRWTGRGRPALYGRTRSAAVDVAPTGSRVYQDQSP